MINSLTSSLPLLSYDHVKGIIKCHFRAKGINESCMLSMFKDNSDTGAMGPIGRRTR